MHQLPFSKGRAHLLVTPVFDIQDHRSDVHNAE